jgi:hypothetical protein
MALRRVRAKPGKKHSNGAKISLRRYLPALLCCHCPLEECIRDRNPERAGRTEMTGEGMRKTEAFARPLTFLRAARGAALRVGEAGSRGYERVTIAASPGGWNRSVGCRAHKSAIRSPVFGADPRSAPDASGRVRESLLVVALGRRLPGLTTHARVRDCRRAPAPHSLSAPHLASRELRTRLI